MATIRQALLFGATGFIGTRLLAQALAAGDFQVTAITRRPLAQRHERLANLVVDDLARLDRVDGSPEAVDVAFICLGSTMKQAGSQQAFRAIDHDLVLNCARWARRRGARHLLAVSAVGVSRRSPVFYNRVKAETEHDLAALGYERLTLMQPSLLLGERGGPARPGEALGARVMPLLSPLLAGPLADYRAIDGADVAQAMLARARQPGPPGVERLRWREIRALAG